MFQAKMRPIDNIIQNEIDRVICYPKDGGSSISPRKENKKSR